MNLKKNLERFYQLINEDSKTIIEKKKLFSIANNLIPIYPNCKNPTECFQSLGKFGSMQNEYFRIFGLENLIKISLIIYFTREGMKESEINKILDSLYYGILFETDGEDYEEPCERCDENGYESCDYCGGDGRVDCSECNGTGNITCDKCEGEGQIEDSEGDFIDCEECSGSGEKTCDYCDGEGREDCDDCEGRGDNLCDECDGRGHNITDEKNYNIIGICSWDEDIKNILEIREKEFMPALKEINLRKCLKLFVRDYHEELPEDIVENEYYSVRLSKEPENMYLLMNMTVGMDFSQDMIEFIIDKV
jgi:hypothetical protein